MTHLVRAAALGAALLYFAAGQLASPARAEEPARAAASSEQTREDRFLYLLRTYPERKPDLTLGEVAQLVDQGPFAERDRAIFWIGSARLALGNREAARSWFARLARESPDSIWVQRSYLGLAEAAAMERRFDEALRWYSRADLSSDATVRERARIARPQILTLQHRQWFAWLCAAILVLASLSLITATWRAADRSERARAFRPPTELRILAPLLAILALCALRQEPAPRAATLELCLFGGGLTWLSGAYLRASRAPQTLSRRIGYALLALLVLACGSYFAIWRNDLVGMVMETWRAGPD